MLIIEYFIENKERDLLMIAGLFNILVYFIK